MPKKIIYVTKRLKKDGLETIKHIAADYQCVFAWESELLGTDAANIEIMLGSDAGLIDQILSLPQHSLKWVQAHSAGVDNLNLQGLAKHHVLLTNASGLHGGPIAEHVLSVLLSKNRSINHAIINQQKSKWAPSIPMGELTHKKMLIFGTGHVGQEVAKLMTIFKLEVYGVNTSGKAVAGFKKTYKLSEVDNQLNKMDIIVNILPYTKATAYYFDSVFFNKVKARAEFINVGRGPSVKTEALITALEKNQLSFAYLDVFEEEPLPESSPLWQMENILITPHISGRVPHFRTKLCEIYQQNLSSYINTGKVLLNMVNLEKGY